MDETIFESAGWYAATTLGERAGWLRERAGEGNFDQALARRELELWRAQSPLDEDEWFQRRLESEGLTEDELLRVLGEPLELVRERAGSAPPWLAELRTAWSVERPSHAPPGWFPPLPDGMRQARTTGFLHAVLPLLWRGRERVRAGAEALAREYPRAPFDGESAADLLLVNLPWHVHSMLARAFVVELNIARVQRSLSGETAEERFLAFVERLREPSFALAVLHAHPLLARQVAETVDRWASFALEFLGHLARDRSDLEEAFGAAGFVDRLARAEGGQGDVHRGGRSVIVADFASGFRTVYKPRSLLGDVRFGELLAWVNERAKHPELLAPRVLERGDHGWVEFAPSRPCETRDEVERFYRRQGGFLALLYVLDATDFHFENLIASGEHPVLVDLETLFHPRPPVVEPADVESRLVTRATAHSVLRIGLLPQRSWAQDEYEGIDISGMSAVEGQMTPDRVLQFEEIATDEMRAVKKRMPMPGGKNRPKLADAEQSALEFRESIARGFEDVYRACLEHRDELLAPDGPIERFAGCELRVVLRATRSYGMLQMEAQHPDLQGDALELERFLDRLWAGLDANPHLAPAVPHERADLLIGDYPFFAVRPESGDLFTSRNERVPDFFPESGLEAVRARVRGLGERDLFWQLWFTRASLATLALDDERLQWPTYPPVGEVPVPAREAIDAELASEARRCGDLLARFALRDGEDVAWIGLNFSEKQWGMVPLLDDLYGGAAGVIYFFAYLGHVTGEERYEALARTSLACFRRRFERIRSTIETPGAFSGLAGVAHLFAHCAALWGESELEAEVDACVDVLEPLIERDRDLDVIGGSAGCAAVLLGLHARGGPVAPRALELAKLCGERIVAAARPQDVGVGWFTALQSERPITGFSHGASGMCWALAELGRVTGDERFWETALAGMRNESTQYLPEAGNWRDAVDPRSKGQPGGGQPGVESATALSVAWCYGAPGIGLARLFALRSFDAPDVREDFAAAVRTTAARGFGRNHSLCHGDLGNLDFLRQAADELDDAGLHRTLELRTAETLASLRRDGFRCGVPLSVESPGLMNGLAGIGYGLLRQLDPERVPSVLALEPPR